MFSLAAANSPVGRADRSQIVELGGHRGDDLVEEIRRRRVGDVRLGVGGTAVADLHDGERRVGLAELLGARHR